MSSGVVHTKACIALAVGFTAGAIASQNPSDFQYVLGALTGVLISPDCDVDSKFIAYKYIRQRLGRAAESGWNYVWYFYRKSVKHGSELSHFPIVGTIFRVGYLFLFAIVIPYLVLSLLFPFDLLREWQWWAWQTLTHWKIVVGLMGADLIHWALDILTTEHKRTNGAKSKSTYGQYRQQPPVPPRKKTLSGRS